MSWTELEDKIEIEYHLCLGAFDFILEGGEGGHWQDV